MYTLIELGAVCLLSYFAGLTLAMVYLKGKHKKEIAKVRKDSVTRSKSVIRASISEDLIPLFPEFPYALSDLKLFSKPVDYIVFEGMSEFRDGNKEKDINIVFADLKTGNAVKTPVQKQIMKAIQEGRIRFEEWRLDEQNKLKIKTLEK